MADAERELVTEETSDKDLFKGAMTDQPDETPAPQEGDQPRDQQGRFAPKQVEEAPQKAVQDEQEPTQQATPANDGRVPSGRLREEREKRESAEREARELRERLDRLERIAMERQHPPVQPPQPPQPPPDIFTNPDEAVRYQIRETVTPEISQVRQLLYANARMVADSVMGPDNVSAAQKEFDEAVNRGTIDPYSYQRVMQAANPFAEAVKWSRERKVVAEVGADPSAYRQRIEAELLENPDFQAKAIEKFKATQSRPAQSVTRLPPSLSKVPGSSVGTDGEPDAASDKELLRDALRRR